MENRSWRVQRLREVLAQLVECVRTPAKRGVLDMALTEADLVLAATADPPAPCVHTWIHEVGWSKCSSCGRRVMVDPPMSPADLARESAEIYADRDDDRMHLGVRGGRG